MNKTIKTTLLNYWNPMRWIALVAGLFFVVQGFRFGDVISGLLGAFFLFQAATNTGCLCGNCSVPAQSSAESGIAIKDVEFTEIKEN